MLNFIPSSNSNQEIYLPILKEKRIKLFLKREDLIHPQISGNKYRKLKYNLITAHEKGFDKILTFGGAFSNHIAAVAAIGKMVGFKTIGVIRGEELIDKIGENNTLSYAKSCGMQFKFVSRTDYREKQSSTFLDRIQKEFGDCYILPEGGTNELAVKGCEEILIEKDASFDVICTSVGTGGTISGLINCSKVSQQVLGFPALKGEFLKNDICKFVSKNNWELLNDYHFGGYAKVTKELVEFINDFNKMTEIPLDPIYTGKMVFGILDLIKTGYFKSGTKILGIHTGGLQGIYGMNKELSKRKLPLIEV